MALTGALIGFGAGAAGVLAAGISSIVIGAVAGAAAGAVFDYVMEGIIEDAQADTMSGRTVTGRDPTASRKIAYGECRTGGTIVYLANGGDSNEYLHQMTCFAVGEVESIEEIWYGDKLVMKLDSGVPKYYDEWSEGTSPSTLPKHTYIETKTGADNQIAVTGEGAVQMTAVSSSSNDTMQMRIKGRNASNVAIEEDVYLTGTSGVTTTASFVKVTAAVLISGTNAGTITIGANGRTFASFAPSRRNTQTSLYSLLGKDLPNQWSANHRLLDICYAYTRFDLDEGHPYDGQPNVTARIKGRKLYDPRKDSTSSIGGSGSHRPDNPSTWEYSNNSALVILDYLTDSEYGANISHDDINYPALEIALDICDENVTTADGTQKRYTCDGIIDTASSLRNNVASILSSMNGKITFSGGQFFIDAYAYKTPHSVVVDEDMMLGSFTIRTKQSKRDTYNQVRGTFMSALDNFQMSEFPTKKVSQYVADDGEVLELEMKLNMTTDVEAAQRLARLTLLRSRMQDTLKMQLNMKGLQYRVGDNIKVSNTKFGIVEKEFEITRLSIKPDIENGIVVDIEGRETQESIFDWQSSYADAYDSGNTIQLYDPNYSPPVTAMRVLPVHFRGFDDVGYLVPLVGFRVSWDAFADEHTRYQVQAYANGRGSTATTRLPYENFVDIKDLEQNTEYEIEIIAYRYQYPSIRYTETHRTGRSTDIGGGTYSYTSSNTVAEMTESDFQSYFGKFAQSGDQLTVLQIDEVTEQIVDSRTYVFQPVFRYSDITGYTQAGKFGNFPNRSENVNSVFTSLVTATVAFEDVTWSVAVKFGSFVCSDPSVTTFSNLSITEMIDNNASGSQARVRLTLTPTVADARVAASLSYDHPVYYETGTIEITASWDNQTHTEELSLFVAMQMDT